MGPVANTRSGDLEICGAWLPAWSVTLEAVAAAERAIRETIVGDAQAEPIVQKLVMLANHAKWEVRRAIANAAAHLPHPAFESPLAKLALDDNSRVRLAAEQAALRRRDSRHASSLGKQHESRINSILNDVAARFGTKGRDAVRRAADEVGWMAQASTWNPPPATAQPRTLAAARASRWPSAKSPSGNGSMKRGCWPAPN